MAVTSVLPLWFTHEAVSGPASPLLNLAGVGATKLQGAPVKVSHLNQLTALIALCQVQYQWQQQQQQQQQQPWAMAASGPYNQEFLATQTVTAARQGLGAPRRRSPSGCPVSILLVPASLAQGGTMMARLSTILFNSHTICVLVSQQAHLLLLLLSRTPQSAPQS